MKSKGGLTLWVKENKHLHYRDWMDGIEHFNLPVRQEIMALDHIAKQLGINTNAYDNRPYFDFLLEIYTRLQ
jgi:hypothetical protein